MTGTGQRCFETLVQACLVIVDQELLDHRLQLAGTEDPRWSSTSRLAVSTRRSAHDFARGESRAAVGSGSAAET